MPTEADYKIAIQQCENASLIRLWDDILIGNTPNWDAGKAFEYLILRQFEIEGAQVEYPYSVKIHEQVVEQIDGLVHSDNILCLVESKDYKGRSLNIEPFAKMRNQLLRRPASTIGSIFTTTEFSEPALILANFMSPQTILLWEKNEVEHSLKHNEFRKSLATKFKYAAKTGFPNYNIIAQTI